MNVRPHIAVDPADYVRPSARVATVAELLDCNPGDIRRMVNTGVLEAHGKGKRGIRVYLDSVRDYQMRETRPPKAAPAGTKPGPKTPSAASTAAFRSAMAGLRAKGIA